ncbi:hypothetical protein [Kribbella sp. DT2]|uniref:hypothetical protein n=1 Tax=Kribbella sp. DT2 TaxID=3393427 RepID=UPI003CF5FC81
MTPHYGARERIVDDHGYTVPTPSGGRVTFRLQLFTGPNLLPVGIATQATGDAGSVVNMAEFAAEHVRSTLLPDQTRPPLWIQRMTYDDSPPNNLLVTFTEPGRREGGLHVLTPHWGPILPEQLEGLLGSDVDLSRGDRYVPQPEPEPRTIRFELIAVDKLPVAHPFRQPQCMGNDEQAGPRWRRGRTGFLLRGILRRPCCWYHQGDWKTVNRLAEEYLRDAEASGTTEVRHAVIQAVDEAELDEWTGEALSSLFTVPIDLDQSSVPWSYINGQHRVQAMRDARVLRTVIAHYE